MNDTLAATIAGTLRQAIWDGVYHCGERLAELTISQELTVSQSTVRDALRILEREGWLVRYERRGVYVRSFNADEAEEVYHLWAVIESSAFSAVTEKITRVDLLNALRPPLDEARNFLEAGRWLQTWDALLRFHQVIADLSERPQTISILSQLRNQARLLEVDYAFNRSRTPELHTERIALYERLFGVIKFADTITASNAIAERIVEEGKPVVRWLAMHG